MTPVVLVTPHAKARVTRTAIASGRWEAGFLLLQGIGWFVWAVLSNSALPGDNVEQLNWTQSLELGYYKHPPLPTWLLHPFYLAIGPKPWLTYALGQACVGVAMWLMWRACALLAGGRNATLALLVLSNAYYFGQHAHLYNHNTVLLVPIALAFLATVSLARGAGLAHWLMLGAAIGLGMLVKYQMAIFALPCVISLGVVGAFRRRNACRNAGLACLLSLALFAPHLVWLIQHGFPTFDYAAKNLAAGLAPLDRMGNAISFVAQQVTRMAPAGAALLLAGWWARFGDGGRSRTGTRYLPACAPIAGSAHIVWLCSAPAILTIAFGLLGGVRLQNHWGTGLMLLAMPLIALRLRSRSCGYERRQLAWSALAIQLLLLASSWAIARSGLAPTDDSSTYPAAALTQAAREFWQSTRPGTLPAVVIGPDWEAGLIAARLPGAPLVLIHANPRFAPWVSRERVDACGALVVQEGAAQGRDGAWPGPPLVNLPWGLAGRLQATRRIELKRVGVPSAAPIVLTLGIVAPAASSKRIVPSAASMSSYRCAEGL